MRKHACYCVQTVKSVFKCVFVWDTPCFVNYTSLLLSLLTFPQAVYFPSSTSWTTNCQTLAKHKHIIEDKWPVIHSCSLLFFRHSATGGPEVAMGTGPWPQPPTEAEQLQALMAAANGESYTSSSFSSLLSIILFFSKPMYISSQA